MRLLMYELYDDNGRVLIRTTTSFATATEWKNNSKKHTFNVKFIEYKEESPKEKNKE